EEDWSDVHWTDPGNVHEVIGYSRQDLQFRDSRPAVVSTTVLIGIIDKGKKNIWVASLGDSDAVCGRMQNGKMTPIILSDRHNCSDPKEVERLLAEHPDEDGVIVHGGVLSVLRVTRGQIMTGDHQLKVQSRALVERILGYFYPSRVALATFGIWDRNRNLTPPYLSSTPTVARYDLLPGDMLVFASDSLCDALWLIPAAERWEIIMSLVSGKDHEKLSDRCIQPVLADNPAELLVKNVLFGTDVTKMANQLVNPALDDISVVVVDLGWKEEVIEQYCTITFNSAGGVTRDISNIFVSSSTPGSDRDRRKILSVWRFQTKFNTHDNLTLGGPSKRGFKG
ncbi:phosphatase 2C-like domain-containing protein, partial [Mycena capillaripes]